MFDLKAQPYPGVCSFAFVLLYSSGAACLALSMHTTVSVCDMSRTYRRRLRCAPLTYFFFSAALVNYCCFLECIYQYIYISEYI